MLEESIKVIIMSIEKKYDIQVGFEQYMDHKEFEINIICKLYANYILIHKFEISKYQMDASKDSRIIYVIDIINNEIENNLPELLI